MKLKNLLKVASLAVPFIVSVKVGAQPTQQATQQKQCPSYVKEFWKSKEEYKSQIARDVSGDIVTYLIKDSMQLRLGIKISEIMGEDIGSVLAIGYRAGGKEMFIRGEKEGQTITKKVKEVKNLLVLYALLNPDVYNCFPSASPVTEVKEVEKVEKPEHKKVEKQEEEIIQELIEKEGKEERGEERKEKEVNIFEDYLSRGTLNTFIGVNEKKFSLLGSIRVGKDEDKYKGSDFGLIGNVDLKKDWKIFGSFFGTNELERRDFSKKITEFSVGFKKDLKNSYLAANISYSQQNGRNDFRDKETGSIEGIGSYEVDIFGNSKTKDSIYSLLVESGYTDGLRIGGLLGYSREEIKTTADGIYTITFYDQHSNKIDSTADSFSQRHGKIDNIFSPGARVAYSIDNFGIESIIFGNVDTKGLIDPEQRVSGSLLMHYNLPISKVKVENKKGLAPVVFNTQAYGGKLSASLGFNRNPKYYSSLNESRIYLPTNGSRLLKEFSDLRLYKLDGIRGFGGEIGVEVGKGEKPIYKIGGSYSNGGFGVDLEYILDKGSVDRIGVEVRKGIENVDLMCGGEIKTNSDSRIFCGVGIKY